MFFVRPDLTTKEIEKRENDFSMFKMYCPNFKKIDVKFKSEFRKDRNPSASITEYNGRLWYKDFGDPLQDKAYNIYQFIMRKYSLSFVDTLLKINEDFNLGLGYNSKNKVIVPVKYNIDYTIKEKQDNTVSKILVRKIKPKKRHIDFWSRYDIDSKDVPVLFDKYKISPISHFWLQDTPKVTDKMYVINDIGFTYDYYWHLGTLLRKIYLPKKSGSNFFTNCNTLITQGYDQLPKTGDLVFVTSSMKDVAVLDYNSYPSVAPSNENVFIQKHIFIDLKKRFKNVVIFYDNDFDKEQNWGKIYAKQHSEKFNIPYITLPDNTGKDPSDFSKKYGRKELSNVIKKELKYVGIKIQNT